MKWKLFISLSLHSLLFSSDNESWLICKSQTFFNCRDSSTEKNELLVIKFYESDKNRIYVDCRISFWGRSFKSSFRCNWINENRNWRLGWTERAYLRRCRAYKQLSRFFFFLLSRRFFSGFYLDKSCRLITSSELIIAVVKLLTLGSRERN